MHACIHTYIHAHTSDWNTIMLSILQWHTTCMHTHIHAYTYTHTHRYTCETARLALWCCCGCTYGNELQHHLDTAHVAKYFASPTRHWAQGDGNEDCAVTKAPSNDRVQLACVHVAGHGRRDTLTGVGAFVGLAVGGAGVGGAGVGGAGVGGAGVGGASGGEGAGVSILGADGVCQATDKAVPGILLHLLMWGKELTLRVTVSATSYDLHFCLS